MSIRSERLSRGLTKSATAAYLGVSRPTYDRLERDPGRLTAKRAQRLGELFGIDPATLFFDQRL